MDKKELKNLLEQVAGGQVKPEDALLQIKTEPYKEMGFAKLDTHRGIRQGMAEVIYGAGKTKEQILKIAQAMVEEREKTVLITRMSKEAAEYVGASLDLHYDDLSRTGIVGQIPKPDGVGKIVAATGGTSDMPVAEEAALTAQVYGNEVVRLYDVGVAGMHRLMDHIEDIMSARVIVAIAGMEGASGQRHRRYGRLSGDCSTHQRRIRGEFRRTFRSFVHAEFLCQRYQCGKY